MVRLHRRCCEEEYVADTDVEHTADAPTDVVDTDVYTTFKVKLIQIKFQNPLCEGSKFLSTTGTEPSVVFFYTFHQGDFKILGVLVLEPGHQRFLGHHRWKVGAILTVNKLLSAV